MKVVGIPHEVAYPEPDYANYDTDVERKREDEHLATLKQWLLTNGWPGERTGKELREPHADGYARYMYADGPRPVLVHLPYGDGWDSRNVGSLSRKEVVARIDRGVGISRLFAAA